MKNTNEIIKKSKHIPGKNAKLENIIRCMILSVNERSSLTSEMCKIDEKTYLSLLEFLINNNFLSKIDESKELKDTTDLIIFDYDKCKVYLTSNYKKCIEAIVKNMLPILTLIINKVVK